MAILCGPPVAHHPSCPARYDALGCICPLSGVREEVTTAPATSAGMSAHGAVAGAASHEVDAALLEAEQASVHRYMSARQRRADELRPARVSA